MQSCDIFLRATKSLKATKYTHLITSVIDLCQSQIYCQANNPIYVYFVFITTLLNCTLVKLDATLTIHSLATLAATASSMKVASFEGRFWRTRSFWLPFSAVQSSLQGAGFPLASFLHQMAKLTPQHRISCSSPLT